MNKSTILLIAIIFCCGVNCFAQGKVTNKKKTTAKTAQTSKKPKASKQIKVEPLTGNSNTKEEAPVVKDITIPAPIADGIVDGMEYVDLGLSVKWANFNLGAESPEGFGDYYAWAETAPKEKYDYSTQNKDAKYYCEDLRFNRERDAASCRISKMWRIPSADEINELRNDCKWEWSELKGKKGYKVTGPNGKYIFIPAAGKRVNYSLEDKNNRGYYRCSTPSGSSSQILSLCQEYVALSTSYQSEEGYPIRPVIRNEKMPKVAGNLNGHEYVDLGLSVKWALLNIGQTELDSEDSDRFRWGATASVEKMSEKDYNKIKKQIKKNSNISGNSQFDAATYIWGNGWRIPTVSECEELLDKCNWERFSYMGKPGYKVTGPNGNFIFIIKYDSVWTSGQFYLNKNHALYLKERKDRFDNSQIKTMPIDMWHRIRPVTDR